MALINGLALVCVFDYWGHLKGSLKESANTNCEFIKHGIIPESEKGVIAVAAYRSKFHSV